MLWLKCAVGGAPVQLSSSTSQSRFVDRILFSLTTGLYDASVLASVK